MKQIAWVIFYRDNEIVIRTRSCDNASTADVVQANLISENRFVAMVKVEITIPELTPKVTATVEVV